MYLTTMKNHVWALVICLNISYLKTFVFHIYFLCLDIKTSSYKAFFILLKNANKINTNKNLLGNFFFFFQNNSLHNLLLRTRCVQDLHKEMPSLVVGEEAQCLMGERMNKGKCPEHVQARLLICHRGGDDVWIWKSGLASKMWPRLRKATTQTSSCLVIQRWSDIPFIFHIRVPDNKRGITDNDVRTLGENQNSLGE